MDDALFKMTQNGTRIAVWQAYRARAQRLLHLQQATWIKGGDPQPLVLSPPTEFEVELFTQAAMSCVEEERAQIVEHIESLIPEPKSGGAEGAAVTTLVALKAWIENRKEQDDEEEDEGESELFSVGGGGASVATGGTHDDGTDGRTGSGQSTGDEGDAPREGNGGHAGPGGDPPRP